MNCYYCDKIKSVEPDYNHREAAHDLGSEAPRCSLHWRYLCAQCGERSHFMATSFCDDTGRFFCSRCSIDPQSVNDGFWAWMYYFEYGSPWSNHRYRSLGPDGVLMGRTHPLLGQDVPKEVLSASVSSQAVYPLTDTRTGSRPERGDTPPMRKESTGEQVRSQGRSGSSWMIGCEARSR